MKYSVWDWNNRNFAVYDDGRPRPIMEDPVPCRPGMRPGVAGLLDVNQALCTLPPGAQHTGWSDVAVGQLARVGNAAAYGGRSAGYRPGLGMLFAPGGIAGLGATAGVAPGGALGFTFTEAVVVNVVVTVLSGFLTTFIFRNAFMTAGKIK